MTSMPCPSPEELNQALLGLLPDDQAEVIRQHLLECPACVEGIRSFPADDPLLEALRAQAATTLNCTDDQIQKLKAQLIERGPPQIIDGSTESTKSRWNEPNSSDTTKVWSTLLDDTRLRELPGYEILEELGRGGMGVVYRARHLRLNRIVALKMILSGNFASRHELSRFQAEAEAVARLQHPNIVQIFDIGQHEDRPYFSMEFCNGGSLAAGLERNPRPSRESARLAEKLARAMHAAHQRGIVHRDLKPANILLTSEGEPKINDFGLAKFLDQADSGERTATGTVMGTPAYMSPEQALGRVSDVDARSDVYALGAILYCMLTGQPPFQSSSTATTLRQVIERDPVSPRHLNPKVDRDLETICLKSLAKSPQRRYASALALAEDLERYLAGESILARRESWVEKLGRKVRRSPAAAGLIVLLVLSVVAFAGLFPQLQRSRAVSKLVAQTQQLFSPATFSLETVPEADRLIAELETYSPSDGEKTRQLLNETLYRHLSVELQKPRLTPPDFDRIRKGINLLHARGAAAAKILEDAFLARLSNWNIVAQLKPPFAEKKDVFVEDLLKINSDALVLNGDKGVELRNKAVNLLMRPSCEGDVQVEAEFDNPATSGAPIGFYLKGKGGQNSRITSACFTSDDQRIATAGADGKIRLWDRQTGEELAVQNAHHGVVDSLAVVPNSPLLISSGEDQKIRVWSLPSLTCDREVDARFQSPTRISEFSGIGIAVSPDGSQLAAGSTNGQGQDEIWRWKLPDMIPLSKWPVTGGVPGRIAFSADGQFLAAGTQQGTINLWDVRSEKQSRTIVAHSEAILGLAFHPKGDLLASATARGLIRLWRPDDGSELGSLQGYAAGVYDLSFNPDGSLLAAAHSADNLKLWDVRNRELKGSLVTSHHDRLLALKFSRSGDSLISSSRDGLAWLWDVPSRTIRTTFGSQNYGFLVSAPPSSQPLKADDRTRLESTCIAQIVCNGMKLRSMPLRLVGDRFRLRGTLEGNVLRLQVNKLPEIVFRDYLPDSLLDGGAMTLQMMPQSRLLQMIVQSRPTPPGASPLERGDALLAVGRLVEAQEYYAEQVATLTANPALQTLRREAQCKAAICLVRLNRFSDAEPLLVEVTQRGHSKEEPAVAIAWYQLWLEYSRRGNFVKADQVFGSIRAEYQPSDLAEIISEAMRTDILDAYAPSVTRRSIILLPGSEEALRRAVRAAEFLSVFHYQQAGQWGLLAIHRADGETEAATELARKMARDLENAPGMLPRQVGPISDVCQTLRDYGQLCRISGDPLQAMPLINSHLGPDPENPRPENKVNHFQLLLEHACLNLALDHPDEAERDVNCFLAATPSTELPYELHAEANLMLGFLRQDRGDEQGALDAWRRGSLSIWKQTAPAGNNLADGHRAMLLSAVLGSLGQTLTDEEAHSFLKIIEELLPPKVGTQLVPLLLPSSSRVFREMWRSSRGRVISRAIAFGDMLHAEQVIAFATLFATEAIGEQSFPNGGTALQHELVWQFACKMFRDYRRNRVAVAQLLPLAMAYKNLPVFQPKESLLKPLSSDLQAPAAYLLGQRYEQVYKRTVEALEYFRLAKSLAAPDAPVTPLIDEELRRLGAL